MGSLAELSESMYKLTYGSTADLIPTPPSQAAADKIFAITDAYKVLESRLRLAPDAHQDDVLAVVEQSAQLSEHVQTLINLYIDDAWEKDKTVEAARLNASGTLAMAVELAQKQVALLQLTTCSACIAQGSKLANTIAMFEDTYHVLYHGNEAKDEGSRRLTNRTKTSISATVENNLINMLTDMRTKWNVMKPVLEEIDEEFKDKGEAPSAAVLVDAADKAKAVGVAAQATAEVYSTSSRTTTSVPLDVLTPLPLTGSMPFGRTMRAATKVAEDMINYQQKIMPGFAIKNRFFDDRCDAQEGMRLVLQESASVLIDYVALGGMGCSDVCANAAFAAASMNMPFLSYECSGRELSDVVEYPGFTRLGTPITQSLEMLQQIVTSYG